MHALLAKLKKHFLRVFVTRRFRMKHLDIYEFIQTSYATNALFVLTKNSVFDHLLEGPSSAETLAIKSGLKEDLLISLLYLAASLEFIRQDQRLFHLREKALVLTKARKSWQRSYLLLWGNQYNPAFNNLDKFVSSGENAFALTFGKQAWAFYDDNPAYSNAFVEFMHDVSSEVHISAIQDLDIGKARRIVDVAGGKGSLACSLLAKHINVEAVVFDQPSNNVAASRNIESANLGNRCRFIGGNVFDSIPNGFDLYLIKHALHDWDDHMALKILQNLYDAMRSDSTLIIIEGVLDRDADDPELFHTRNLEQRVSTGGKVRRRCEFQQLCTAAGLEIVKMTHTNVRDISFIKCHKIINRSSKLTACTQTH